jgi:hypothetical protein
MPRKPQPHTSDDIGREIERLQQQRAQVEAAEHARRGELLRQYLDGPKGDDLRALLDPLVGPNDRHLFRLGPSTRAGRSNGAAAATAISTGAGDTAAMA